MKLKLFIIATILSLSWFFSPSALFAAARSTPTDTTTAPWRIARAVETNDTAMVKKLLEMDPGLVNTREPFMDDPLLVWAARKNQPAMVSILLKSGADIHATNKLGSNTLHLAAFTGNYALMERLIIQGADWSVRNLRGKIPVDYVSFGKNPKVFELFLEKDRNCLQDTTPDGSTLLHLAANAGDTAGFTFLLSRGLDISATNNRGANVVHHAMENRDMTMLEYLQHHGADLDLPDNNGFTPLYWGVMMQNPDLTLYLLGNGADVNYRNTEGQTPLMMAVGHDNPEMIKLLFSKGADLQAADHEGKTALHLAAIRGSASITSFLVDKGVKVNAGDNNGMTPLHYSAIYGYAEIGKVLLVSGADPLITDNAGHDAAYYCGWYGNTTLSGYMHPKEAKDQATGKPENPLTSNLPKGKAVVHYLNHSGYAIETANYLLIFDYFQNNDDPTTPSLLNGRINPDELKGKQVIVFISHDHGDHYDTTVWEWQKGNPDISYVMGFRPETVHPYAYIAPREETTIRGVNVHAIRSTDSGAGFLTKADGIVVYHPGDHVNKSSEPDLKFKDEIDYLAGLKEKVDIAFFPVAGCGFPDLEAVKSGNFYVIETLKPTACFTMHAGTTQCAGFAEEIKIKFPGQHATYGKYPGDRFSYSTGYLPL
jgi:ankyrin repeat protein/L-ascorbate metabolism protein UlaG (beta-lactamase superfamily)